MIIGLLFLSWLIKYPDTITVQVKIKALNSNVVSRNINSSDNIKYFGEALVSESCLGKIRIGQDINIKLISYPFNEYGILKGKIKLISELPIDGRYAIKIVLPNGLTTSYKKKLKYYQGMTGNAEIILQDLRLIEKILYRFKNILGKG